MYFKGLLSLLIFAMPLWLKDCLHIQNDMERTALVQVGSQTLYLDQVMRDVPAGLSSEDSVARIQMLCDEWAKEALMYESACRNLSMTDEIEEMVENYRRSLLVYQYQQQVLDQKLEATVTEDDIQAYYKDNSSRFVSSQNLIKGIFIKVPLSSGNLDYIRRIYRKTDESSLEGIESFCLKSATAYQDFSDEWTSLDDVLDQIPYEVKDQSKFLKNNSFLDIDDDNYCYLLSIHESLPVGQSEPLEFVSNRIRNILINSKRTEFLRQFEQDMFEEAKESGAVRFIAPPKAE